jgi:hypothetical protein
MDPLFLITPLAAAACCAAFLSARERRDLRGRALLLLKPSHVFTTLFRQV